MKPEVKEVFRKLRDDVFTEESRWTQGAYAKDAAGKPLANGWDEGAVCWCFMGGVEVVIGAQVDLRNEIRTAMIAQNDDLYYITTWNDSSKRTFADIRKVVEELAA